MRFICETNVGHFVSDTLRRAGHDVERHKSSEKDLGDREILRQAFKNGQILVTEDRDFAELIFRDGERHCGLVLIGGNMSRQEKVTQIEKLLRHHTKDLKTGRFIQIDEERIRCSLPKAPGDKFVKSSDENPAPQLTKKRQQQKADNE